MQGINVDELLFNIPDKLKSIPNWLLHKNKIPYYISGEKRSGVQGSEEDKNNLALFNEAIKALENGNYSGLGFAILPDCGIIGVDFDKCLKDGEIVKNKKQIEQFTACTYAEISPSGYGIRLFFEGSPVFHGRNKNIEIYSTSQYVTVTGKRMNHNDIMPIPDVINNLIRKALQKTNGGNGAGRYEKINKIKHEDPIYHAIKEKGIITQETGDGKVGIECPFSSTHTTKDGPLDCVYFHPNTFGFKNWNIKCLHAHCGDKSREDFLNAIGIEIEKDFSDFDDDGLPIVELKNGELFGIVEKLQQIIRDSGDIFERSGRLVRLAKSKNIKSKAIQRDNDGLSVIHITPSWLRLFLSKNVNFIKYNAKNEALRTDCKKDIAETIIENQGAWDVDYLSSISDCPIIKQDGTIIKKSGYDFETGIYFNIDFDIEIMDIQKSKLIIDELFSEFPFEKYLDKSVAVSALLTSIIRPVLPSSPFFIIDSPTPGTGKSILVDVISIIATGRYPTTISVPDNDKREEEKAFDSILLAGDQIVNYDNIEKPIESAKLATFLTQESADIRILGKTGLHKTPSISMWFGTGNNINVLGDLIRRTLKCRLNSFTENPEERIFKREIKPYAFSMRREIVSSCISIIKIGLDSDIKITPWGSFDVWSRMVRKSMITAGYQDPIDAKKASKDLDDSKAQLQCILDEWRERFDDDGATISEAIQVASGNFGLEEAFKEFEKEGKVDAMRLRHYIQKNRGVVCGGLYFDFHEKRKGRYPVWVAESVHEMF